jgi:hypothetical protein
MNKGSSLGEEICGHSKQRKGDDPPHNNMNALSRKYSVTFAKDHIQARAE